jgi:peptidoglycan-N-acetylglucosamine deacetylase
MRAGIVLPAGPQCACEPGACPPRPARGHTAAHHTFSHRLLDRLPVAAAEAEIDRGFAAIDTALHGRSDREPRTPFFRFPGFASSAALLDRLEKRGIVVFGADLWASDWNPMSPQHQLAQLLARLEANRGGIVLLHDTKLQSAAMLPPFLRALKARDYRLVHVVPVQSRWPRREDPEIIHSHLCRRRHRAVQSAAGPGH